MDTNMVYTVQLTAILFLGIFTKWISTAARIPSILLLLIVGVAAGPITGLINPGETLGELLIPITSLSVAIILFEGGLSLKFQDIKSVHQLIRNLVTFGAAAGFFATFLFLHFALGFETPFSLLLSAILMITGPTVITPLLHHLHIKQPVRSTLKWEGIVIDPVGALTAVILFEAILHQAESSFWGVIGSTLLKAAAIGLFFGGLGALIIYYSMKRFWIPDPLHSPVTLVIMLLMFTCSNLLQEDSGLLSVTIMGIALANQYKVMVSHIIDFKENLRVILISFLFIVLAGMMDLRSILETAEISALIFLFLIFIARPLGVFFSGAFFTLPVNQALFMCFLAPRGIVCAVIASLFGLRLTEIGYADAELLMPVTFAIIGGTVTFYSIAAPIAAKLLGVSTLDEKGILIMGANPLARAIGSVLQDEGFDVQHIDPHYQKAADTKKSLLKVFTGTFLEYEKEHLDQFDEMSMFLAMTENNDINSMAVSHMRSHFDESALFQLPTNTKKIRESLMGQQLFSNPYDYETLSHLLAKGAVIKATQLTPEFTYDDWKETYQEKNAILLFYINSSGTLIPQTKDSPLEPTSSGKLIFMSEHSTGEV